jgi:hypothetical protein
MGIPKHSVLRYEVALKSDKFLLIVHGTDDDTARARAILESTGASQLENHPARATAH